MRSRACRSLKKYKIHPFEALVLTLQSLEPLGSIFGKIPSSLTSESLSEADIVGLQKKNKENTSYQVINKPCCTETQLKGCFDDIIKITTQNTNR